MRLDSLAILCHLATFDDLEQAQIAFQFLLETEVFPLCLNWMEMYKGVLQVLTCMVDQLARNPRASNLHKVVYCLDRFPEAAR